MPGDGVASSDCVWTTLACAECAELAPPRVAGVPINAASDNEARRADLRCRCRKILRMSWRLSHGRLPSATGCLRTSTVVVLDRCLLQRIHTQCGDGNSKTISISISQHHTEVSRQRSTLEPPKIAFSSVCLRLQLQSRRSWFLAARSAYSLVQPLLDAWSEFPLRL